MTRVTRASLSLASRQIVNGEWQIEHNKKREREQVHLEKIKRAIIRESVKQCFRLRFVKKKTIIEPGELVRRQRDNEIQLRPGEDTNDGEGMWP
jgi:hypothetical protein